MTKNLEGAVPCVILTQGTDNSISAIYHEKCFAEKYEDGLPEGFGQVKTYATNPQSDKRCNWCNILLYEEPWWHLDLVDFSFSENGNLVMAIQSDRARREIMDRAGMKEITISDTLYGDKTKYVVDEDHPNAEKHRDVALADVLEYQLCNGWDLLNPNTEDYLRIGALTSAPILSETVERDEEGDLISVGVVYWYPEYEVFDPIEQLLCRGKVIFTKVE